MTRLELQYVGMKLAKINYLLPDKLLGQNVSPGMLSSVEFTNKHPEYAYLLSELCKRVAVTSAPGSISIKNGKITAYNGYCADVEADLARFKQKRPNLHSVSVDALGRETAKVYWRQSDNLPVLPQSARMKFGVATTYALGGERIGNPEIFFEASDEEMRKWASEYKLGGFIPSASYYGVAFRGTTPVGPIKACLRTLDSPHTENCWVSGAKIRTGVSPESFEGKSLIARVPDNWLYNKEYITNTGSNFYDLGLDKPVEIISVYYNMVTPSRALLDHFGVPNIDPPKWFGIKYAPKYGWTWLKVANMDYSKFEFPALPVGAAKTFGVASVYPLTANQPVHHSSLGDDWVDLSFSTRNHRAVREYCVAEGLDDPAPHLPDTLQLWGVYSLTYNAVTKKARRMKFYDYEGTQRYMMEMYVSSVLGESVSEASKRVMELNLKMGVW